jgi:hypothetical protein
MLPRRDEAERLQLLALRLWTQSKGSPSLIAKLRVERETRVATNITAIGDASTLSAFWW